MRVHLLTELSFEPAPPEEKVKTPHEFQNNAPHILYDDAASTRLIACDTRRYLLSSTSSCFLPRGVSEYMRARRLFSVCCHSALSQPFTSIRCKAGYKEPSSTRKTSRDEFSTN